MDETQEQSIPKAETVVPPELKNAMDGAKERIQSEAMEPQADIVERTSHLSLFGALRESAKEHTKNILAIKFKDLKVGAMAALSLIPLVGEGASAARAAENVAKLDSTAAKQMAKFNRAGNAKNLERYIKTEAKLQRAQGAYRAEVRAMKGSMNAAERARYASLSRNADIKGLGQHIGVQAAKLEKGKYRIFRGELGKGVHPANALEHARRGIDATKTWAPLGERTIFGKKVELPTGKWKMNARMGGENLALGAAESLLHTLDPYPDVPGLVSMFGMLEIFGVHGAELAPSAWQFVSNQVQLVKEQFNMSKDALRIVASRMGGKYDKLKEGHVQRAAEAFIPTPAKAAV